MEKSMAGNEPVQHPAVLLIVQDDVLLRLVMASSLRDAGFEVVEAANSDEAVLLLNSVTIDAVISDVNVPGGMGGFALAKWIRDRALNTKIILTSATEQSLGDAERYAHFLAKPYDDLAVRQLLRRLLR
jgi:CheY-like chemotaxis protein